MLIKTIIMVISVLAILEGLFATIYPKNVKELIKYFTKKPENYYFKVGIIELIIASLILSLTYYFL